jgi:uncharacterized protein involved in exopolysaccharide biosynthesis
MKDYIEKHSKELAHNEIDLYDLLIKVWHYRNILFLFTSTAACIGLMVAIFGWSNMYTSTALLMPKNSGSEGSLSQALGLPDMGGLSKVVGLDGGAQGNTHIDLAKTLLTSRGFVLDFVKRHDYLPEIMTATNWDRGSNRIIYDNRGYDQETDKLTFSPSDDDIYKNFLNGFSISTARDTQFVTLEFIHFSPYFAKEVLDKLIIDVNKNVKIRETNRLQKSIEYLNNQFSKTLSIQLQQVFISLRETNIKNLMLAEIDEYYVLDIIDPPNIPFLKTSPKRTLILVLGTLFGPFFGIFFIIIARFFHYDPRVTFLPIKFELLPINK